MEKLLTLFELENNVDMAKDPAFLFFPGDWLGGTMTFSRAHKGAYMDLLMCQFNQGHMTIQDVEVVLGDGDFRLMWETKLRHKFIQDECGRYFNEKLEKEMIARKKFTDSRKSNLSGISHKDNHMGAHKITQVNPQMEDGDIDGDEVVLKDLNVLFETFWNLYDKKVGEKGKLTKKWEKLKNADREAIIKYIPLYKIAKPDKKYRLNPETFLNNKGWLNELIYDKPGTNGSDKQSANGTGKSAGAYELLGQLEEDLRRRGTPNSGGEV